MVRTNTDRWAQEPMHIYQSDVTTVFLTASRLNKTFETSIFYFFHNVFYPSIQKNKEVIISACIVCFLQMIWSIKGLYCLLKR